MNQRTILPQSGHYLKRNFWLYFKREYGFYTDAGLFAKCIISGRLYIPYISDTVFFNQTVFFVN